ncbi:MAG: lipase, partial [Vibrio sp.]
MKTPYVKTKIIALSSVFLLAACGGGSSSSGKSTGELEPEVETSLDSATKINFAFQGDNVSVPVPSFLLLDSQTGRLNIPTDGDTSLSNPSVALNQLDGWSTNQAIQIPVTGSGLADGVLSQGVYLIKLTQSLLADSPSVEAVLSVGTDFQAITRASDNTINIIPSQPFDEKSNYILALTSEITDIDGEPVGTSEDYALLKTQTIDLNVAPLEQLQDVTQGIEGIFAQTGVDASSIIYSTWFTTQSVGDTLAATKAAAAAGLANAANGGLASVWKDSANPNSVDLSTAYTMGIAASGDYAQMLDADENFDTYLDPDGAGLKAQLIAAYQGITGADTVTVSKGVVNLPYFLETGDTWNTQPFEAAMPSLALISNALADGSDDQASVGAQLANAGITPSLLASDPQEQLKLIGLDLTKADGTALDSERVVTQYNPVPKIKSLQAV